MLKAICNRDPAFLKTVYPLPIDLVDHERHIQAGHKYLTYDGRWRVWRMTAQRVPLPQGAFPTAAAAIFMLRKK